MKLPTVQLWAKAAPNAETGLTHKPQLSDLARTAVLDPTQTAVLDPTQTKVLDTGLVNIPGQNDVHPVNRVALKQHIDAQQLLDSLGLPLVCGIVVDTVLGGFFPLEIPRHHSGETFRMGDSLGV